MSGEIFKGAYGKLNFPEYRYVEYPKMLYLKERDEFGKPKQKIVYSQAEELRAMDEVVPVQNYDALLEEKRVLEKKLAEMEAQKVKNAEALAAQKSPNLKVPEGAAPSAALSVKK